MLTISATVIWFQRAVANTSMRLAEPSRPTIWAPSSRPERRSASTLIVIGSAPGEEPGPVLAPTPPRPPRRPPRRGGRAQRGLGQAGAGDLDLAHLGHGRAEHAREGRVAAADVDAADAALLVGDRPQVVADQPARHQVAGLGAVTGRPDPVVTGLHARVDGDGPARAELDAGRLGQAHRRPGAEAEDDQV